MLSATSPAAVVSFLSQNEVFSSSNPFPILTNSVKFHPFSTFSKNYSLSSSSSQRPFSSTVKVSVSDGTEIIKDEQGINQTPKEESPLNSIEEDIRQTRRSDDWKAARTYKEKGSIYEGRVEGFNGGGLLVRFYTILGFLPYPLLSPSHACKEPRKSMQEIAKDLVGSLISVKVTQASEEDRKLIFSEKEAMWSKYSGKIKVGQILTQGERLRVTLSIKQLEDDPLLETLDKVIPQEGQSGFDASTASDDVNIEPLPGLASICEELLKEDGITDVKISRQGFEKMLFHQIYNFEVHLETTLDQEGIKRHCNEC
ncbi:hypothetical protein MKW92_049363 [Papaver armeniacum]|nr:hypothetical protein MKW92_049363 [Papaver armeniacum]